MKFTTVLAALAFTLAASASQAQTAESGSASAAQAGANAASGAASLSGVVLNQDLSTPSTIETRQSGSTTARIESAPSLGGLAVGGGHPCAWTPGSAQLSIIGGGLGGAQMQVDEACMLAVMAAASGSHAMQQAALLIIAGRDDDACKAMYQAGIVSDCVDKQGRSKVRQPARVSTKSRSTVTPAKLYTSCRLDSATNQIMIKYTSAGRKDKVTAGLACQRALGY